MRTINSYERVMNTLQGLPADRVPVFAVLGAYGGKLTRTDLKTLYSNAQAYVAGQQAARDILGFDMILATFDYSAIAEAFGGEVAWFENQAPNMKRPAVQNPSAAAGLDLPDPERTARLPVILSATRQLASLYRGSVPVFAAVPGSGALPALALGLEAWMETVLFDEDNARRILERTGRFFLDWAHALCEAGVTGLVVTESVASVEISTRNLFEKVFLPHLRDLFSQINAPLVFHHGGGRILHMLDLLPGLPGVAGVVVGSRDDLGAARASLGTGLTLIGNLDNLSLPAVSAAEIRRRSLECLKTAAPAGRYILSHSAADVPLSTPLENLQAMLQAAGEYAARETETS